MEATKAVIHFIHDLGNRWEFACLPDPKGMIGSLKSSDPRAVNCKACMGSNVYLDRMASIKAMEAGRK